MSLFFVIDATENLTSWSNKTESGEKFRSVKSARKRALELAASEPGKKFYICQVLNAAVADVASPKITAP